MRWRMYGCQPRSCIFSHRSGLLSPRSRHRDYPHAVGNGDRQQIQHLDHRFYPLALFVGGHDDPRHRDGASPIDHAHDDGAEPVGEHCRVYGEREVFGRPQRQDPSHERGETGADIYLIRRRRGAVGAVAEPLAEPLPNGGESAREVQGGDDGVLASAFGGYGSEGPEGESFGLRLAEVRHGLSDGLMNLITFGWEAHGEPPAALRFLLFTKMPEKPCAFQVPKPVSGQTYPCKPFMGEG